MELKKKRIFFIVGIIVLFIGIIGLTRAFLSTGGKQDLANTFTSGCLSITIDKEGTSINLSNQAPITDIEGLNTEGYNFTIKNNCSTSSNYQINLESLNQSDNSLSANYVRVSLSSDTMDNLITKLGENTSAEHMIDKAYEAFNLYSGTIDASATKEFTLKEWLDYDTTVEQGANKTYQSRINVVATSQEPTIESEIKFNKKGLELTGTITGIANTALYCTSTDNKCNPDKSTDIKEQQIKVTLEDKDKEQIVCTKLDEGKVICSNPASGYCPPGATSCKTIIANRDIQKGEESFTAIDDQSHKNNQNKSTLFTAEDDYGDSLYFRGKVDDNWLKFGKTTDNQDIWWRIIRINGNGTVRLIYTGIGQTAPNTTGTGTQIKTTYSDHVSQQFNATFGDNTYVGFMNNGTITSSYDTAHQNSQNSTIKKELDDWWITTDLGNATNVEKIDIETGFCNDRSLAEADHGSYKGPSGGRGTTQTVYAGTHRVWGSGSSTSWDNSEQEPTLKCANLTRDLFTGEKAKGITTSVGKQIVGNHTLVNPVGLITMDEVIYAGEFAGENNTEYWLYTNQPYWTMTPYGFSSGSAVVFYVDRNGYINGAGVNGTGYGVRPVINLKADLNLIGNGTTDNPYQIKNPNIKEAGDTILANSDVKTTNNIGLTACDNGTNTGGNNNNCGSTDNGLYTGTDDDGDTYYFRGSVKDNWVKFAGFYWRIIRINGDGTIRLIYSGKEREEDYLTFENENQTNPIYATGAGSQIGNTENNPGYYLFNNQHNDNKYVGYMYGNPKENGTSTNYNNAHINEEDSNIKEILDNWYITNIADYKEHIDINAGFCGDRTPYNGSSTSSTIDYSNYGYSNKTTYYGGYYRLVTPSGTSRKPTFSCKRGSGTGTNLPENNDLYTVNNSNPQNKGNKALTNPIGLITADEATFAGGAIGQNNGGYYLYSGVNYWTMSPSYFNNDYADMFVVLSNGYLTNTGVSGTSIGVRPVINLKADTHFTFAKEENKGTFSNPYLVQ